MEIIQIEGIGIMTGTKQRIINKSEQIVDQRYHMKATSHDKGRLLL